MSAESSTRVVLATFNAVEERDLERLLVLYHPDVEFVWPPSLPYGGSHSGPAVGGMGATFAAVWDPLQPTDQDRRMDPRVIAATDSEVVVHYRQRAVDGAGERFETEVLGLYRVRDDKLARAQMFYFDLVGLEAFLSR